MIKAFSLINADWNRYLKAHASTNKKWSILEKTAIFFHNPNMFFIMMYRVESYLFTHEIPILRYLGYLLYPFYFYINYLFLDLHIHPTVKIDKGFYLHYKGIIITKTVSAGENLTLMGPLTIGTDLGEGQGAKIGKNVTICTGARIIGDLTIGDNVIIGAGSVVVKDIPSNVIVAGVPAKIIKQYKEYKEKNNI